MFIAAPAGPQAAMESVRRLLAETAAGLAAPHAIVAVGAISADGERAQAADPQQRLAGRTVPALVLSRIDAEQGIVEIAGERLRIAARLPEGGRTVMLRFPAAPEVVAATALRRLEPASEALAGSPSPRVVLGPVAQALSQVASREAPPLALGAVAARVETPLAFASALAALVRDSGVFYESHLARWTRGQYPLAQLQVEPQAHPSGAGAAPTAASAFALDHPVQMSIVPDTNMTTGAANRSNGAEAAPKPLVAPELQPILREQLGVLEHRGIAVTLEAWPGQQMALSIRDQRDAPASDPDGRARSPAIDAAPWSTRLTLDLPRLGRLHVELGLTGNRMQLVLEADAHSAARLGRGTTALADAMAGAGIRLSGLRIVDAADL